MGTDNAQRAQIARINRRLARDGQMLRKVREDSRWYWQYGPYHVVNVSTNSIVTVIGDLDELERELREGPSLSGSPDK